jgi:hypothetical protein
VFYFIISRLFPGLGIGTFITICCWVARVSPSLISPPFLIKSNTLSVRKEYLIVGAKIMKISENTNIQIKISLKFNLTPFRPPLPGEIGNQYVNLFKDDT